MDPIYTIANCRFAYQLNWSLAVLWTVAPPPADAWLPPLQASCEPDGVRILEHRAAGEGVSQFLVSTVPAVAPVAMARCVKGRLQHLIRAECPKAFRRNYAFRSVGSATRRQIEQYVAGQHSHHPMADPAAQTAFEGLCHAPGEADLSAGRTGGHCRFWYNLHVVLVNDGRWRDVERAPLEAMHRMALDAARRKGHILSRAAVLADHVHLALGPRPDEPPAAVALSYMNNLAYAVGMQRRFAHSAYVGTFGEYDVWGPWFAAPS